MKRQQGSKGPIIPTILGVFLVVAAMGLPAGADEAHANGVLPGASFASPLFVPLVFGGAGLGDPPGTATPTSTAVQMATATRTPTATAAATSTQE